MDRIQNRQLQAPHLCATFVAISLQQSLGLIPTWKPKSATTTVGSASESKLSGHIATSLLSAFTQSRTSTAHSLIENS